VERRIPLLAGLAAAIGLVALGLGLPDAARLGPPTVADPGSMLTVMRDNGFTGRVWNDFNWGGLLLWALPDVQVACDGRNVTAYSTEAVRVSMSLEALPDAPERIERSSAELILLEANNPLILRLSTVFPVLLCDRVACLLSRRPSDHARAAAGLRLPATEVSATSFFEHGR
jgi:hypothetical protein